MARKTGAPAHIAATRAGTLKDVALLAGVSISTVSRALTGKGLISEQTEKRIRQAAEAANYRPNTLARGLKTQRSRLIGLMVHNLVGTSHRLLAEVAQQRLGAAGFQVILCVTGDDAEQEARFLTTMENYRAEGLIVIPTGRNGPQLAKFAQAGVPVIAVIRRQEEQALETILHANEEGAQAGTRYLLDLGHRDIGFIVGRADTTSGRERYVGHVRALTEAGLRPDPSRIHFGAYRPETGFRACEAMLANGRRPTAIFVANHEASMGAMRFIRERAIDVPEDLSLLCYEDTPWFAWNKPAITVVDSGPQRIAELAVERLLMRLDGVPTQLEHRVDAALVIRESCAAPA
ncbi:LacI family DNA-binding transcriptional regulator [Allostella humosa]|uniref:LacI family DNA-binding transcriptional regulator n=1 Tax=Stella humosa TaxID=94 RepID=UPI0018D822E9|nr:LacI family DNA-binding transcriptional regulator [Stella humosa]